MSKNKSPNPRLKTDMYLVNILDRNANLIGNLRASAVAILRSMPTPVAPAHRAPAVPGAEHSTLLKAYRFGADAGETMVWMALGAAGFCAIACAVTHWFLA